MTLLFAAACGDNAGATDGGADASPADAAPPSGQGSLPAHDVALNEVASSTAGADWIEVTNRSAAALDVSGWFVTDSPDRLDHFFAFPAGTTIDAGGYVLVYADDGAAGEGFHAPFKLSRADSVYVLTNEGIVIDAILFLDPDTGATLARVPDREGLFFPVAGTPGAANPEAMP